MAVDRYLIDTDVFLHNPRIINDLKGHKIYLSSLVLEEIGKRRGKTTTLGDNASFFLDYLKTLPQTSKGTFIDDKTDVRIWLESLLPSKFEKIAPDMDRNHLLNTALSIRKTEGELVLLSRDPVTLLLSNTLGINTKEMSSFDSSLNSVYKGIRFLDTSKKIIDQFYKDSAIKPPTGETFSPYEYCILKSTEGSSAVSRYDMTSGQLLPLTNSNKDAFGIKPRNIEQKCALDLLLDDQVKLVTLIGQAGTGKTLLALASALRKVFDEGVYDRIVISRSVMPLGKDIGFLPGTKEEKMQAWLGSFFDNLDFISNHHQKNSAAQETKKWILESEKFQLEAITYMRGRSFSNTIVIIDEAQNLTAHEIKTIISRIGYNSKVIVIGDPSQIDNHHLNATSNGLIHLCEKMKSYSISGNIIFSQTERSELAEIASKVL